MLTKDEGDRLPKDGLPEELRAFITVHIPSVAHLELLMLLANHPDRTWTADQVSKEMRTNLSYANSQLDELAATGLLQRESGSESSYRFAPADDYVCTVAQQLMSCYAERRFTVINAIYSRPLEKIRVFADAFKLRKD